MNKFKLAIIILLISAGITKTQTLTSQNSFNAKHAIGDFKITTFNVEWLTCTTHGPTDEELQMNNIVTLIKTMNSDIVALQEVEQVVHILLLTHSCVGLEVNGPEVWLPIRLIIVVRMKVLFTKSQKCNY